MDITFFEMGADPRPREEVRLEQVGALPLPDGRRIWSQIIITPFLDKPNLELTLFAPDGRPVGGTSILEVMSPKVEPTVHVRIPQPQGRFRLRVELYYDQNPPQDSAEVYFDLPPDPSIYAEMEDEP
ncbi:MAG TPA: hypothetical protein PK299_03050 [Anaerolineales bacterium]|nr:hypothetical protein [Anaerolineales bacterium]